jgi:hypothetical protein
VKGTVLDLDEAELFCPGFSIGRCLEFQWRNEHRMDRVENRTNNVQRVRETRDPVLELEVAVSSFG